MTNVEELDKAMNTIKIISEETGAIDNDSQKTMYLGFISKYLAVIADKLDIIAKGVEK